MTTSVADVWYRRPDGTASTALVIAVALAALVPLLVTPVYPFIDFYAHIVRFYVLARIDEVAVLAEHYAPAWKLLPNLGLDLFGTALMEALPPLAVARIIAFLMLAVPFCGVLVLSRVLHGYIPLPGLLLAGILIYSHILIWGFANFLLGIGTVFLGLALWVGMAHRPAWQLGLSAVLGVVLIFVHGLSFALWGLLLGTIELMRAQAAGEWRPDGLGTIATRLARLAVLAVIPALLFLQMQTTEAEGGVTRAFDNLAAHAERGNVVPVVLGEIAERIDYTLRVADSTWPWLDRVLGLVLWGGLVAGLASGVLRLDRRLWLAAALAVLLMALMPPNLFGVGYLDDRMPLVLLMVLAAGISLRPRNGKADPFARHLMLVLAGLLVLRLALTTSGWYHDGQIYRGFLDALAQSDTGRMGAAALFDDTGVRTGQRPTCKPLSFLMVLENDTAVTTFANPTQQPLALKGPLLAARGQHDPVADADRALERRLDPNHRTAVLAEMREKGYDTIVVCDADGAGETPPGFAVLAARPPWTLYAVSPQPPAR